MTSSSYPNGFTNGVTIRGLPIQIAQPGKVFFVNNSSILAPGGIPGSDFGPGSYLQPFKTVEGALSNGKLTNFAGRGDILMVMPNHAETISNATLMALNCAGVTVVGLGDGISRPTFTFNTATSATITINAANMSFINCIFVANFASIAAAFTVNAVNFYLGDCQFQDSTSILNFVNIISASATTNAASGLAAYNNKFYGLGAASNTCFINSLGTHDKRTFNNNYVTHTAVTGGGFMQTASGKNITNLIVNGNTGNFTGATSLTTGVFMITGGTANTGVLSNNFCKSLDDTSPILVTASSGLTFYNNYYQANADKSGFLLPAVDS